MRTTLAGGQPSQIAAVSRISGASWRADDRIVVGVEAGLLLLSATGGTPPDTIAGTGASLPQFLPGGEAILFPQHAGFGSEQRFVDVITIRDRKRARLIDRAADGRYVPTGHIVFGRLGAMMAVPFDSRRREVTGTPVTVLDDVMQAFNGSNSAVLTGAMQVAISPFGNLVYLSGGITPDRSRQIYWLDRQGRSTLVASTGTYPFFALHLSPDERRVAVTSVGMEDVLHVYDIARASAQTLKDPGIQLWPLWSRDGLRIVRRGFVRDTNSLVWSLADGSRPATSLVGDKVFDFAPAFWSLDEKELFAVGFDNGGLHAINVSDGSSRRITNLPDDVGFPVLSPDGTWLAYSAVEAGSLDRQVFVQPWPALDRKWKVSTAGGTGVKWTKNGRELIIQHQVGSDSAGQPLQRVTSLSIDAGPEFSWQPPRILFTTTFVQTTPVTAFEVTADGSRLLVIRGSPVRAPAGEPRVIFNWFTELRRLSAQQAGAR